MILRDDNIIKIEKFTDYFYVIYKDNAFVNIEMAKEIVSFREGITKEYGINKFLVFIGEGFSPDSSKKTGYFDRKTDSKGPKRYDKTPAVMRYLGFDRNSKGIHNIAIVPYGKGGLILSTMNLFISIGRFLKKKKHPKMRFFTSIADGHFWIKIQ